MASPLDELLMRMRAGRGVHAGRRKQEDVPPHKLKPHQEELKRRSYVVTTPMDIDLVDELEPPVDTVIHVAPKRLQSSVSTTVDDATTTSPVVSHEMQAALQAAIALKRKALNLEKAQAPQEAIALYTDAGYMFLTIGRAIPPGTMQTALKMEAFSMLKRAESLTSFLDRKKDHQTTCRPHVSWLPLQRSARKLV
ncbi:Aste57867_18704 [Aphanomyces stellatus]|uniref:Aste57867_18704 protein n=1 Tax=Aphanomyces stellatus TaxID=120398 RepID=A0A485LCP0_9STRA|nr:hypothetical protein As57867_018641 [Aphanomyces stellatus]VFT95439.1 Aste57867_18704 [Aphanomyces stellatus]